MTQMTVDDLDQNSEGVACVNLPKHHGPCPRNQQGRSQTFQNEGAVRVTQG